MNWNFTLGFVATIGSLTLIIFILAFGLYNRRCFLALAVCILLSAVYNLSSQGFLPMPGGLLRNLGITNNLLDGPLMLIFLTFFTNTDKLRKQFYIGAGLFLLFEAVVIFIYGFSLQTIKIVLGPDIVLIVGISLLFFMKNVRMAIVHKRTLGKAIIISAVLIAYSIYSLIYVFHYLLKTKYIQDAQLVYYLVTILSSLLLSTGIFIESKRIKKLNELKIIRKELADIYGTKNAAAVIDSRI
ncbi:MAG: hypothetical protein C4308_06785 [Chitinophagaceae bacterium]